MATLITGWPAWDLGEPWAVTMGGLLVKGGALLLLIGGLAFALRGAAAATRHLLWTLGICGLLLLPFLTVLLPTWRVETPTEIPLPVGALRFVPPSELAAPGYLAGGTGDPPSAAAPGTDDFTAAEAGEIVPESDSAAVAPASTTESGRADAAEDAATSRSSFAFYLFLLWFAGVGVVLGGLVAGSLHLRRILGSAREVSAADGGDLVQEIKAEMGIERPVDVVVGDVALSPQTWGFGRQTVLLPAAWRDWSDEKRRQVLVHELAHIRRGDCLTQAAAHLACAIYWCNPLVWLAAHRMRIERERACDDHVLSAGATASSYADNLLEIASTIGRHGRPAFGEVPMARSSQMSGRLLAVLDGNRQRRAPGRTAVALACLLLVAIAAPLSAVQTMEARSVWDQTDGNADRPVEVDLADFEKAWQNLAERMKEAVRDHDAASLASCYTEDAKLYTPGLRTLQGRDEVEDHAETFWSIPVADFEVTDTEFFQVGDMVCCVGKVKAFDDFGEILGTNRFMSLYRYENGRWRIHRDIVNN